MVADPKKAAREEFAKLFNEELDRVGAPKDHKRTTWALERLVVKHTGRPLVSREQVRKWMSGIDIPDQANLWAACKLLKLSWTRLQPGAIGAPNSPPYNEFQAVAEDLTEAELRDVIRYAKLVRLAADNNNKARAEGKDSEGGRSLRRSGGA